MKLVYMISLRNNNIYYKVLTKKMDLFQKFIQKKYNINEDQYKKLFFELERFLELILENNDISPNNLVDIIWHDFILETELYYNYCIKKFGRIVNHSIMRSNDSDEEKQARLNKTISLYYEKYNEIDDNFWRNDSINDSVDEPAEPAEPVEPDKSNISYFSIQVIDLFGRKRDVEVHDNMMISHLKKQLNVFGKKYLRYNELTLNDEQTIKSCGINRGAILKVDSKGKC